MSLPPIRKTPGETDWFVHDRFGMFIHFGLYAMAARHEWMKRYEKMADEDYQRYFERFDPDLFDPAAWAKNAKRAGMKYVVITTKHHEGFCLWDTKYTDYKVTNTPFGRDLLREAVDAFRAEGIRIGFYYSLLDWHHPDFPIDMNHPDEERLELLAANHQRDMKKYAQYMRDQVTELLTEYGKIDILWFDFSYGQAQPRQVGDYTLYGKGPADWESEQLLALCRSLQPHLIINDRTGIEQDLITPEQTQADRWPLHNETGERVLWETCQTFSGSWGYYRDECSWKTPEVLIRLLIKSVSLGGNLIMNVGPTARGYFDHRAEEALGVYEKWMKFNSRAIYGCTMADPAFKAPEGCLYTQSADGKRLYLHLLEYPLRTLVVPGLADKLKYAQFLHDGSEIIARPFKPSFDIPQEGDQEAAADSLMLRIPQIRPDVTVPVIELFLD